MTEIDTLQQRLAAALDRIGRGVEAFGAIHPGEAEAALAETAELRAQLSEERTANAQLAERVRLLKERQDTRVATLEAQVVAQRERLAAMDHEMQGLRQSGAELRAVNDGMARAMAEGLPDAGLVNRAMLAELESLRASRDAEIAEIDAVMQELRPLIEEQH